MSIQSISLALLGLLAAACGGPRIEPHPAPSLPSDVTDRGDRIYVGHVFPLGSPSTVPTYVYERRVVEHDGALVSTHVTRDPAGEIQLAESATHSAGYELADYTLHANQLGQHGSIHVEGDEVSFRLSDGEHEKTRVEHQAGDVVVGPTLVGYVFRRLDALAEGEVAEVRLAVLDRLETIGFELEAVDAAPGQTRVRMSPSSFLVGLAIDPIHFTFDTSTKALVRLEGRVPTKIREGARWSDFDARVEYELVASSYR
jgi:hypothetical protein